MCLLCTKWWVAAHLTAWSGGLKAKNEATLSFRANWLQPVMWEELNYSIMHPLRTKKKKKWRGQQARHVWVWKCLHHLLYVRVKFLKCFLTACAPCLCVISFLTLCPWPAARSGFWFTMNMAEDRVRQGGAGGGEEGWLGGGRQWVTQNLARTTKTGMWTQRFNPGLTAEACSGRHYYGYLCSRRWAPQSFRTFDSKTHADPSSFSRLWTQIMRLNLV